MDVDRVIKGCRCSRRGLPDSGMPGIYAGKQMGLNGAPLQSAKHESMPVDACCNAISVLAEAALTRRAAGALASTTLSH